MALLLFICSSAQAQTMWPTEKKQPNTLFAELGGNGYLYSLNYDHLIIRSPYFQASLRVGVSSELNLAREGTEAYLPITVPLEANIILGYEKGHFELGWGFTPIADNCLEATKDQSHQNQTCLDVVSIARIGYRYQQHAGGLFFRVGLTLIDAFKQPTNPWPIAGLSVGWTLKKKPVAN